MKVAPGGSRRLVHAAPDPLGPPERQHDEQRQVRAGQSGADSEEQVLKLLWEEIGGVQRPSWEPKGHGKDGNDFDLSMVQAGC